MLVFISGTIYAQKLELGKVTVEELQQKVHPSDSSAAAAILFKKGETIFEYSEREGFVMITKVKTKIKIYKKEGYEWANHAETYYLANDSKETVDYSDAVTYNLVDGKIVKTKLKSDGEFDQKINKYWGQKKITMPNVTEGCIVEYEYSLRSPNFGTLKDWNFQTTIPVNFSEYITFIPEYYYYKPNQKGYIFPKIVTEKQRGNILLTSAERSGRNSFSTATATASQDKIDFEVTKTTYIAANLPAMKDEAFVNNIENYMSSVAHELSMVKFPNKAIKYYSTDWASLTKTIYEHPDFGTELGKTGYFEDEVNALIAGMSNPAEKIAVIFNYVKSNVHFNDYYSYYCNDGVRQAFKNKTGNVAEINLMLTAMLRYAGINANPVLVSTRSNGVAFFPNRSAYNYVIAAVEVNDGLILLDATEKYSLPNVLPLRDLNWFGRLIRKDGTSTTVNLVPKSFSNENINMLANLSANGEINGKVRRDLTDQNALSFRQKNVGTNKDNYLEILENENNKIEISDYVIENEMTLSKPIVEKYAFKSTNDVEIIGDKLYVSPLLFFTEKTNPFKQETREYPVDFGFPTQTKYNISLEIPEGYIIESLPKPINLSTENKLGSFKWNIVASGNKIQIAVTAEINEAIVAPDYYLIIKDFFQKMNEKQSEKIILKKV